jgi:hypothetical protein
MTWRRRFQPRNDTRREVKTDSVAALDFMILMRSFGVERSSSAFVQQAERNRTSLTSRGLGKSLDLPAIMPIKKVVSTGAQNPAADPRTAAFSAHGPAPAYQPVPEAEAPVSREGFLNATLDRELNYFFNVANGTTGPNGTAPAPTLVLNLFRATDPTKKPVAERFFLGQAQGAPYYALYANPSIRVSLDACFGGNRC